MITQDPHPSGDRGWIINLASVLGMVASPGTGKHSWQGLGLRVGPHNKETLGETEFIDSGSGSADETSW